ncbi:MAG: membrane lipoprotein lipid attachment site-containing protein [Endomicrobia bacterium]|nr:membrane lipoprotein lipid attachment site-containing protein [Endomicrobiia bacterium]MCL2799465.1 membrane lipoprotein lipid attachment site-containing protein [Endomicrobiia bacterium]
MKKLLLFFIAVFVVSGCAASKSPDVVKQEMSGSYKRELNSKKTSVVIIGAYNNLEFDDVKNFREVLQWSDGHGNIHLTDFADKNNPLYIQGRHGVNYIAVKVLPGKYTLKNFIIRWSAINYAFELNFGKRYSANFEIGENEVLFVGILRTTFDKFTAEQLKLPGETKIKVSSFIENGKEDLYKITNFYSMMTKTPVITKVMYWNDSTPGNTETLIAVEQ